MPRKAILSVCGRDFKLLEFNVSLVQKINNQGKPASGVYLGDFYFLMPGGNDVFFDWLSDPERMESGIVKVYYNKAQSPFVEYSFVKGFVTTILENYYENDQADNSFNRVSTSEDLSENFEFWTNVVSLNKQATGDSATAHALSNSVGKTRQFQQRTGIAHVLMVTMSCEQITIRNLMHDNMWTQR
ncbi:type VI secretion system tube protein TssD [Larkinella sp. VNQ87]|uniref:type VI secretion system tube protein TssD n=1 Tax=Larkinella sp. VNQ87 TaxID=3400921 RepID=UPI003C02DD8B